MKWTLQRKISAALLLVGCGALFIDGGLLFGGGAEASADPIDVAASTAPIETEVIKADRATLAASLLNIAADRGAVRA